MKSRSGSSGRELPKPVALVDRVHLYSLRNLHWQQHQMQGIPQSAFLGLLVAMLAVVATASSPTVSLIQVVKTFKHDEQSFLQGLAFSPVRLKLSFVVSFCCR